MELQVVKPKSRERVLIEENTPREIKRHNSPFIEANTKEVSLSHLQERCTIPVFAKDNEVTISHQDFIKTMTRSVSTVFPDYQTAPPQIRGQPCYKRKNT